jgi:PsbP
MHIALLLPGSGGVLAQNETMSQTHTPTEWTHTPTEWKTHEDPVLGISIKHPEGWTTSEEPDILDIIGNTPTPPDGNMTTVTCRVLVLPSVQENSTTAMREYLNDRRGEIEVISANNSLVIDGISAYKIHYISSEYPESKYPKVDYTLVDSANNMEYSVICSSNERIFNQFSPVFEEMAKSLNIL